MIARIGPLWSRLEHHVDIVRVLLSKELKVRYKSTVFGYLWSVMNPLLLMLVYYFAFKLVARIDSGDIPYAVVLVTGLFPWQWISNAVQGGTSTFLSSGNLIKRQRFPRSLLVVAQVSNDAVHFLISLPVIFGFLLYFSQGLELQYLWWLPIMSLLTFAMSFGGAILVATGNLFLRDLERMVGLIMMVLFFVSPVMYPPGLLEQVGLGWVVYVNPIGAMIVCWRSVLLDGSVPWVMFAVAVGWTSLLLTAGVLVYRRYESRFAEIV
jgi:lipopolysaccharide transport system permease protein